MMKIDEMIKKKKNVIVHLQYLSGKTDKIKELIYSLFNYQQHAQKKKKNN